MSQEKWALVLGANSDIAKSCAKNFASNKFNICLASRDIDNCIATASDIEIRYEVKVSVVKFDATDLSSHTEFFDSLDFFPDVTLVSFGVLYNQIDLEKNFQLRKEMVDVNLLGVINSVENLLPMLLKRNKGSLVLMGSAAGDRGKRSNYIYGSTKAAIETYYEGVDHRLHNTGVRIILIKPGFVETKMTLGMDLPLVITASPHEVAKKVYNAVQKEKKVVYVRSIWRLIMLLIRLTPRFIFNKTSL